MLNETFKFPRPGMLATVRNRRGVISSVDAVSSDSIGGQTTELASILRSAFNESEFVRVVLLRQEDTKAPFVPAKGLNQSWKFEGE